VDVPGCTDPLAENYNPDATENDESCEYPDNGEYSLSFDGVDDYVDYIAGVEPSGALSIGAWFKTTMTGTGRIVSKKHSDNIFFTYNSTSSSHCSFKPCSY
jgi:hypothetical protein